MCELTVEIILPKSQLFFITWADSGLSSCSINSQKQLADVKLTPQCNCTISYYLVSTDSIGFRPVQLLVTLNGIDSLPKGRDSYIWITINAKVIDPGVGPSSVSYHGRKPITGQSLIGLRWEHGQLVAALIFSSVTVIESTIRRRRLTSRFSSTLEIC